MTELRELLSDDRVDMGRVSAHLDNLPSGERKAQCMALGRSEQRRLFDAAQGFRMMTLEDLVPKDVPAMSEVPHHGKNTIPIPGATRFAKVCVRPDGPEEHIGEIWGYNRNSQFLETVVGPGFYVAHAHHVKGEVLVNYLRVPPRKPAHWPEILRNDQRLSFFVYNGTQDVLRGVSKHVSIGRAQKGGSWMPAWFILCRD